MVLMKFYPSFGGAEKQALLLSSSLIRSGERVTVVTGRWDPAWTKQDTIRGVPVRRTWCWGRKRRSLGRAGVWIYGIGTIFEIWKLRKHFDILHVHQANEAAFFAVLACRLLGKRILIKVANSGETSDYNQLVKSRGGTLARRFWDVISDADCFVCINDLIPKELVSRNVQPEKLVKIPNGVEILPPPGNSAAATPKMDAFMETALAPDRVTVIFVGKLYFQKGVDTLLEAWKLVERDHPGKSQLLILGDGPRKGELAGTALEAGFFDSGSVIFSRGWIETIDPFHEIADLLVLPSRSEGMPNVVLEAMSNGVPVVVSKIPGCTNLVVDGEIGVIVEPENPRSLAEGLSRLISDETMRRTMGQKAREAARKNYDIKKVASEYRNIYSRFRNSREGFIGLESEFDEPGRQIESSLEGIRIEDNR